MLKIISKAPPTFTHTHASYSSLVHFINDAIAEVTPRPFGFKSVKSAYDEHSRFIIPSAQIFASDKIRPVLKNWAREVLPEYLEYLGAELNAEDFTWIVNPEHVRMALRFRILQDRDGYSLAPHKDSADTLFAFILQLDTENPTTSLYLRDKKTSVIRLGKDGTRKNYRIEKAKEYISLINSSSAHITVTDHQFGVADAVLWERSGDAWQAQWDEVTTDLKLIKYNAVNIELGADEVLGFHNPLKDLLFSSSLSKYWQQNCCHGFYPRIQMRPRNVMLFDLLVTLAKNEDVAYPNDGADDSYYVLMGKQTSLKLLKSTGLIKGV